MRTDVYTIKLQIIYLVLSKSWCVVSSIYETFENNPNEKFTLKTNSEENSYLTEWLKEFSQVTYIYGTINFFVKQKEPLYKNSFKATASPELGIIPSPSSVVPTASTTFQECPVKRYAGSQSGSQGNREGDKGTLENFLKKLYLKIYNNDSLSYNDFCQFCEHNHCKMFIIVFAELSVDH